MNSDFTHSILGRTGIALHRLGLSATYRPGQETIHKALDLGMNFFFCYGFDTHMTRVLRNLGKNRRQGIVIATGAYNLIYGHPDLRRTLEKRLRQLGTDYIDIFLFLGVMKPQQFGEDVREEMIRFREEGKVRAIGMSCHDREFAGKLASGGALDVYMVRYNAAHRGAETDIFSQLAAHDPGIISYTATRWGYLIRKQKGRPSGRPIPTPGQCYRFVLSNPNVDVVLTAPKNESQLLENFSALKAGPLSGDEMALMRDYGDLVHGSKKWFM